MVAVKEQWFLDTQLPMLYENKHTIRNQSRQGHSLSNKEEIGQESVNESRTLKVFDFFFYSSNLQAQRKLRLIKHLASDQAWL